MIVCVYCIFFTHSSDGHFEWLHNLAVVSSAAMNMKWVSLCFILPYFRGLSSGGLLDETLRSLLTVLHSS